MKVINFVEHKHFVEYNKEYTQHLFKFPNGYGASVVRNQYSYGGEEGLFELAVLDEYDELTYNTPITNDVLGWLSEGDVLRTLNRIEELTKPKLQLEHQIDK